MALNFKDDGTGIPGQELIQEINKLEETNKTQDSRLLSLEYDGFHIGDIRYSFRNTLGDKYLLCNGAEIFSSNYSNLVNIMEDSGKTWYKINMPYTNNKDTWFLNGENIYHFISSRIDSNHIKVEIQKYSSYHELIEDSYKSAICTLNIKVDTISGITVVGFKNKLFLHIDYTNGNHNYSKIYTTELENLNNESWLESPAWNPLELDYNYGCAIASNNEKLVVIFVVNDYDYDKYHIHCLYSLNGEDFTETVYTTEKMSSDLLESWRNTYDIYTVENYFFVRILSKSNNYTRYLSFYNKSDLLDDWDYSNNLGLYHTPQIVYWDNYYWCCNNDNKVVKYQTMSEIIQQGGEIISVSSNEFSPCLIVRNNNLFSVRSYIDSKTESIKLSSSEKYNKSLNVFEKVSDEERRENDIVKEYWCNNKYKCTEFLESDDIYLALSPVSDVDNCSLKPIIIFKNEDYSTIPTIPYDSNLGYAYIKAKE